MDLVGIVFSGSARAGEKIWLAHARPARGRALRVTSVAPASALPGGAPERGGALAALRTHLAALRPDTIVGLDFPFGLPAPLVAEPDWGAFARAFPRRHPTPERFRADCNARANGRELKRATDIEAKTPFSPYNLRLHRQTHYGVADVLAPLVEVKAVRIAPMMARVGTGASESTLARSGSGPTLIEVCPASTLKPAGRYAPYKGAGAERRAARAELLGWLADVARVRVEDEDLRGAILDDQEGDALDAVIAALAAWTNAEEAVSAGPRSREEALEGRVYV